MNKAKGSELIFISRIQRDGKGVELINNQDEMKPWDDDTFEINCLSITNGTYIASSFNSYVVRLKNNK